MVVRALTVAIIVGLLAGPAFAFSKGLGIVATLVSVGALAGAIWEGVKLRRARDPYDLGELKRVHQEESWRPGDPEAFGDTPALVVCSRCRSEYDSRLRACPHCGAGA